MPIYSQFSIPTLGMLSQSHAFGTISNNIANISTGGFKASETRFSTLLSDTLFEQSDIGGTRPYDINRIANQGLMVSGTTMDLAVNGTGFFVFNTQLDGSGDTLYGRDGAFELRLGGATTGTTSGVTQTPTEITGPEGGTIDTREGYLVDKNGYFLQGWEPEEDGSFTNSGELVPIRVDQYAFTGVFDPTTTARLDLNLPATDNVGDAARAYAINVVDSDGVVQSVTLQFEKSDPLNPLVWEMTSTTSQDPTAQVDTLTLSGAVEAGDRYSVSVNGQIANYTVQAGDTTLDDVRDGLLAAIALNPSVGNLVIAAAGAGTGELTLTARDAGTAFATVTSATPNAGAVAQSNSVTIGGTFEQDDTYSVTVNGNVYSYTSQLADVDSAGIATQLAALIAAGEPGLAVGTAGSVITLTANVAGTPFTLAGATATDTDGAGLDDQTIATAVIQANVSSTNDQALAAVTTTANVPDTVTSAATQLTFEGGGALVTPTDVALALTFAGGATADVELDLSQMTAFAGEFNPVSFDRNGFASASLVNFTFDELGQVLGKFDDGTNRPIYKLPLAVFSNINGLDPRNGNVFAESELSGEASIVAAGVDGFGTFLPETHELSNVDLGDEFTRMIKTQAVYNAAATTFRTVDEMTTVARDLKR